MGGRGEVLEHSALASKVSKFSFHVTLKETKNWNSGGFNVRNMRENPTGGLPVKKPGFRVERLVNVL